MLDWTDRDYRYFMRLLTPSSWLYTEMVTTGAILHGDRERFLDFDTTEHPVALQLGGSDPEALARCTQLADRWGYDEINLNVGCPSDRVQSGRFGACLMADPSLIAECVTAMRESTTRPVTIKHRTGIDDLDTYDLLSRFVATLTDAGCDTFIVHARKAWLQGLSPKQNRDVPPLHYEWVYQLKKEFPDNAIVINGGISTVDDMQTHLQHVDGVMIGRAAYHDPWIMAEAEQCLLGKPLLFDRIQIAEKMLPYIEKRLDEGMRLNQVTRHILGLFHGQPGAKQWRRHLSENAHLKGAGIAVVEQALDYVR
ncbi:MAG: tRNA dihydrouridine(20/20a) synthase DusA [bacterium]